MSKIKNTLIAVCCLAHVVNGYAQEKSPVDYVNPYIGNISHLLVPTFPTVHLPNSMLRVVPDRPDFTSPVINGLPVFLTGHRGAAAFSIKPFAGAEAGIRDDLRYSYEL
jgi:hypothetical protein